MPTDIGMRLPTQFVILNMTLTMTCCTLKVNRKMNQQHQILTTMIQISVTTVTLMMITILEVLSMAVSILTKTVRITVIMTLIKDITGMMIVTVTIMIMVKIIRSRPYKGRNIQWKYAT
jgi:hypothetical protein